MTTLEQIKAAAKMGYSAILEAKEDKSAFRVVFVGFNIINAIGYSNRAKDNAIVDILINDLESDNKIIGYTYVGHLFGEPVIPEGQKFRVKVTGERLSFEGEGHKGGIAVGNGADEWQWHKPSELEPIFT